MEHPNCTLSREEIIDEIWGWTPLWTLARWTSTCGACVTPLLTKGEPDVIRTVRTAGYALHIE
jgi:DNA-binding response OmpR family regulator